MCPFFSHTLQFLIPTWWPTSFNFSSKIINGAMSSLGKIEKNIYIWVLISYLPTRSKTKKPFNYFKSFVSLLFDNICIFEIWEKKIPIIFFILFHSIYFIYNVYNSIFLQLFLIFYFPWTKKFHEGRNVPVVFTPVKYIFKLMHKLILINEWVRMTRLIYTVGTESPFVFSLNTNCPSHLQDRNP